MSAAEAISAEVASWPGVESGPHRFGGVEFHVGRRQLGHLHGDEIADLPLPRALKQQLIEEGRARAHRWTPPESGWVTVEIGEDPAPVIELFRVGYDRAMAKRRQA